MINGVFDGVDVFEFSKSRETPFFLISERKIRGAFRRLVSFLNVPPEQVFYSLKANYQMPILQTLRDEGSGVEVFRRTELEIALAAGWDGSSVIMDGPCKTRGDLEAAVAHRVALVNAECQSELAQLDEIAAEAGIVQPVGIRVRLGFRTFPGLLSCVVATQTKPFGFSPALLPALFRDLRSLKHVRLVCVSAHGTLPVMRSRHFARLIETLFAAAVLARSYGHPIDRIDIGGGFPSEGAVSLSLPSLLVGLPLVRWMVRRNGGAAHVLQTISRKYQESARAFSFEPLLISEPGRCLVDDAMAVIGRVIRVEDKVAMIDISTVSELGYQPLFYARRIAVLGQEDGRPKLWYQLCGPTSNPADVIDIRVKCPQLEPGNVIMISNVGAYCTSQSRPWMLPRCECYFIGRDGAVRLSRRRETSQDLLHTQC